MPIEDIIRKIESDTADEIVRIKHEADEKVAEMINECEQECREILDEGRAEGERLVAENARRIRIQTRLDSQKELLQKRTLLIETVFAKLREKLCEDDERYLAFLKKGIISSQKYGNEKMVFSKADHERFGKKLLELATSVNEELSSDNRKGEMVLTNEKGTFEGGFVLKRGRSSTVVTLDTVIEQCRDLYLADVSRMLKGGKL